ncbi:MAG: response regulator transcription factor [Patescibacteria group bacterium]|nr:response regulator transcription factor [Patescibacteria group bacterium]
MQIAVMCYNHDYANFVQKGLAYENIGSEFCFIENSSIEPQHLSKDAFLILSKNPEKDLLLVKNLREKRSVTPIIFMAESISDEFELELRDASCDLIFSRPFSFSLIAMQIKYLVYLSKSKKGDNVIKARSFTLDMSKRILRKSNRIVPLRNKEFALMEYLMMNPKRVLPRTEIVENVWDRNTEIMTNTIDVHISKLRKKIGTGSNKTYIQTINCVGYLFDPS